MNLESLKLGFQSYIEEKLAESGKNIQEQNTLKDSDISIFMYSNEFKDYLVEEVGADVSIFSKSLSEIMSMDFVDGKFVEPEDSNSDTFESENSSSIITDLVNSALGNENVINALDTDKSGNLSKEEAEMFLGQIAQTDENGTSISFDKLSEAVTEINNNPTQGTEEENLAESGSNIINRLLDKVYSNKTVIKTLDEDGDGVLSDEEKAKFEEFIKGYDGNNTGELTEADIKRAFDDIIDGKFSYDNDLEEVSKEIDDKVEEELEDKAAETTPATGTSSSGGTSSAGGFSGGGTSGSSNSFSSSNATEPKTIENMSLEELESEKTKKESEVKDAQEGVNEVYSGENSAVKSAEEDCEKAKEAYDEAVENDDNISEELKQQREDNLNAIAEKEDTVDGLKIDINNKDGEITEQESVVSADKSNISALESALSSLSGQSSDDEEKQAEINNKKAELETKITEAKNKLEKDEEKLDTLKDEKQELETQLETEENALSELEKERSEIEDEIAKVCGPETKEAMQAYNEAKDNVQTVKDTELKTAQDKLTTAQGELDKINEQISVKQAEKTEKENSVSDFDFDFELNLSDRQANELELFKENWEKNKDKYEAVEEATGMPAELVAAIHWREGSGNFDTYLHNGQKLGQTTTVVPKGIYFEDWTEAAIDAVTNYGSDLSTIDPDNIETYYNYAEHYNGMGYANKGLPSPYVWAGTDNYEKGKYVADGQFDPNYVDQQLGVAVMLRALLE